MSRSESRSRAIADLVGRLPPAYFTREFNVQAPAAEARPPAPSSAPATAAESGKTHEGTPEASADNIPASGEPLEFKELPSRLQNSISLTISMLVYSQNAGQRRITINGSTMHEGQEVSSDLKIETIIPDGAIFTYQGYRFRKTMRGN